MSEITWAELTKREREILSNPKDANYSPIEFESWNHLYAMGLIERHLAYFGLKERNLPYWIATDLGRAVLAQADAKPDSGATGAKNAHVEAGEISIEVLRQHWGTDLTSAVANITSDLANGNTAANDEAIEVLRLLCADLASAKAENGRLRAALEGCIADCTLSTIYVGDFYRDATKRVKARAAEALQAGTEGG